MWAVPLALLALGLFLLWQARRQRERTGLPAGRLVSLDTLPLGLKPAVLFDPALNLAGRPDYLVEQRGEMIPVEVKSGKAPRQPHLSHTMQLAAYCRLVQSAYGRRPSYGIIRYADRAFVVDNDLALEGRFLDLLAEMRRLESSEADRSHEEAARCRACGFRERCDQALA